MQVRQHPAWESTAVPNSSTGASTSKGATYENVYHHAPPQQLLRSYDGVHLGAKQTNWQHPHQIQLYPSTSDPSTALLGFDNSTYQSSVTNGPLVTPQYAPSQSQWQAGYIAQAPHQSEYGRGLQQQRSFEALQSQSQSQSQTWSVPQVQSAYDEPWQQTTLGFQPSCLQMPSSSPRQGISTSYQAPVHPHLPPSTTYAYQPQLDHPVTAAPQWPASPDSAHFAPGSYDVSSFDPGAPRSHSQTEFYSHSGSDTASSHSSSNSSFTNAPFSEPLAYPFDARHFANLGLLPTDSPSSTSSFADSTFPTPTYALRPAGPSRTGSQLSQYSSSENRITNSNASTPPSAIDDDETLPIVAAAAYKRAVHIAEGSPLHYNPARKPPPGSSTDPSTTKSNTKTVMLNCWTCSDPIAKANLRTPAPAIGGQALTLNFVPKVNMTCRSCLPFDGSETSSMVAKREASYKDTLSAAIDRLEGLEIKEPELNSPETDKDLPPDLRKHAVKCDVCNRLVASGTISAPEGSPEYTVETICVKCNAKYAPCSDCGGGGGRLSPGRWRCIELFPDGRKTCKLSHLRSPPASELIMEMVAMNKIPPKKLDALCQRSRTLYFNTRMAVLARPEMLEKGDGLARSYQEAEKMCIDQWNLIRQLFYDDVESTKGIRRYLLTQSAHPRSRRGVRKIPRADNPDQDMIISGVVVVEYEFATGSVFYPLVTPWSSTGHGYESNRVAGEEALQFLRNERDTLNFERSLRGFSPYPPLEVTWFVAPFSLDSKMTQGIERRGYRCLAEYTQAYPDVNLNIFPPIREIFIPRQYLKAIQVWACKLQDQREPDLRGVSKTKRKAAAKLGLPEQD